MCPLGLERRPGERRFRANGFVDPLDLHRVDIVFTSSSQEGCLVGCHPDRFDHQWTIEELHDVRYPLNVRIRVLYRYYRCPCDLWFV